MRKELKLTAISICTLSLVLVGLSNYADAAAYIKFDGIDGEVSSRGHDGWIDIISVSHSISRGAESSATARSSGIASFSDIVITKELDKSSPKLAEAVSSGRMIPMVAFELTSASGTYLKYELKNVMVTSYSMSGNADDRPMEEISLNFEEIKVTYTEYGQEGKAKGNVEYSWKVEEGSK